MKAKSARTPAKAAPVPLSGWQLRAQALGRSPLGFALASLLLLVPCFWQSRIQAGDLSSHIYNAWLAQQIRNGQAPGLTLATQTTNVLFDLLLEGLLRAAGAGAAQRIAVSLAVLAFVWGAFAFISAAAGRRAWNMLPAIALLAYGWVFHMGFFNFYLSLGLCFLALGLAWQFIAEPRPPGSGSPVRAAFAALALLAAFTAHSLPVLWTLAIVMYGLVARRVPARFRARLAAGAIAAIVLLRFLLGSLMTTHWSPQQILYITGADQTWIFNGKYGIVFLALAVLWLVQLAALVRRSGSQTVAAGLPFHFCLITAAGIFLLPTAVLIPGYKHALVFIAERMSLALAICVCALVAQAPTGRPMRYGLVAVLAIFFAMLYRDGAVLNGLEDRVQAVVNRIPAGQRVVMGFDDFSLRVNALTHMVDRACTGRCYSYANYEASTEQFRVRAMAPNAFVAATYEDSWNLQTGGYTVKERDLPLYRIDLEPGGALTVRSLPAGRPNGISNWSVLD